MYLLLSRFYARRHGRSEERLRQAVEDCWVQGGPCWGWRGFTEETAGTDCPNVVLWQMNKCQAAESSVRRPCWRPNSWTIGWETRASHSLSLPFSQPGRPETQWPPLSCLEVAPGLWRWAPYCSLPFPLTSGSAWGQDTSRPVHLNSEEIDWGMRNDFHFAATGTQPCHLARLKFFFFFWPVFCWLFHVLGATQMIPEIPFLVWCQ